MSREFIVRAVLGLVAASCSVEMAETQQAEHTAPIAVSPRMSAISEAGDTAFFTIALASRPRGPVKIDIAIDPASEAQAVPPSVIFMPNDWAARSIQIVAIDDDVFDGDIPLTVKLDVLSPDPMYASYTPPPLGVLSVDDDYVVTGYRTVDLFGGAEVSNNSLDLNNRGQVIADVSFTPNRLSLGIWDKGVVTDLGYPTRAMDINDAGVIIGFFDDINRPFRYEDGQFTELTGQRWGINEQGHTVGDALYVDGQRIDLRDGEPVIGTAINSHDHVTGSLPMPPFFGQDRAFYWDGQLHDLGSFGGPRGQGLAINEHDQLVGFMWDAQINYHAVYYDGGAVIDLGTATGNVGAVAAAINNRGDIAGYDHDGGLPAAGWVGRVGQLTPLQSLLVDGRCFFTMEVFDINDRGEILARASECNVGSPRAFLFEPIKAPR
jgi:hypothetical protein